MSILYYITVAYLLGILAGWRLPGLFSAAGALGVLLACAATFFRGKGRVYFAAILPAVFFVSWFSMGVDEAVYRYSPLTGYLESRSDPDRPESVAGTVINASRAQDGGLQIVFRVEEILTGRREPLRVSGLVGIYYPAGMKREPKFGERWRFEGRMKLASAMKPAQRIYYRRKEIVARLVSAQWGETRYVGRGRVGALMRIGDNLRDRFSGILDESVPAPYNQVLGQMMLGKSKEMDSALYEAFRRAGLVHVLVVSGMNVWIMLGAFFFIGFLWKRRPVPSFIILSLMLAVYYAMTGGGASILRATIMGYVFLAGLLIGADYNPRSALFVAALFMMVIDPLVIFQIGAQLTFLAAGGVIFIYPALGALFPQRKLWARALHVLLVSTAAQLPLYPLLAYHFNQFCVVSPISNLLVVPLVGIILPLDFVTCLIGLLPGGLVAAPAFIVGSLARLVVFLTRFFAALPFSNIDIAPPSLAWMAVYGAGLVLLVWTLRRMADGSDRRIVDGWLGIALIGTVLVVWGFWSPPLKEMRVTFFDVGEGDSALLEIPAGERGGRVFRALIDGGGSWGGASGVYDAGERVVGRYLRRRGVRRLDAVVLSHPDMDHMNGLFWVVGNIKVDRFIDAALFADTACAVTGSSYACEAERKYGPGPADLGPERRDRYAALLQVVKEKNIDYEPVAGGSVLSLKSGAELRILNPDRIVLSVSGKAKNDMSLVLRAEYGSGAVLFTGDIEYETEDRLSRFYERYLAASVLKVPHHGSRTSSSDRFLKAVRPSFAVISTGGPMFYGHPHTRVLDEYGKLRIGLFRTDKDGTVMCSVNSAGNASCSRRYAAN